MRQPQATEREGLAPRRRSRPCTSPTVCHVGQGYFLESRSTPAAGDDHSMRLYADFLAAHERVHRACSGGPTDSVNLRSVHGQRMSSGANARSQPSGTPEMRRPVAGCGRGPGSGAFPPVAWDGSDEAVRVGTRIATRDTLAVGDRLRGPAIVEQDDTTTLIAPGWSALVGDGGIMTLIPESTTVRA